MFRDYLKIALIVSLAAHLLLFGFLMWGASLFKTIELVEGGGNVGGTVSVWITSSGGDSVGHNIPQKKIDMFKGKFTGENSNKDIENSTGKGSGSGSGVGSGVGNGGNPILASIFKKVDNAKYYPQIARRQRIIGMPRVIFAINEDGSLNFVKISQSCGEEILDSAAVETIKRAAPLPFYPGRITLTVRYSLND